MARGKRRPPMKPTGPSAEKVQDDDEVEQFVNDRLNKMMRKVQEESSDEDVEISEPGAGEKDVLNIDMSDSEGDSDASESSDDEDAANEDLERKGWGGKKRLWYGGDTHEYEIMEDEEREEALKDEEEEAIRLQNEALSALQPEDFQDEDAEETDAEADQSDHEDESVGMEDEESKMAEDVLSAAAPEVPVLFKEMVECRKQAKIWKERVHWNELARIIYHLHASFVNNVAFYLSIRTDPDAEGTDLRTHPVLVQITRIRSQLKEALSLPCEKPQAPVTNSDKVEAKPKPSKKQAEENKSNREDMLPNEKLANGIEPKKSKAKKRTKQALDSLEAQDEDKLQKLIASNAITRTDEADNGDKEREKKRRKLSKIVGAMERERKNDDTKRLASADADVARRERVTKSEALATPSVGNQPLEDDDDFHEDDDEVVEKMLAKKAKKQEKKARKATEAKPHVYTFKDDVDPEARRRASSDVVKNRGLTRYRPKDKKTPRTKNRLAYSKAVVRRKGAVRDFSGTPGSSYAGEASGINMSARKGSRLSNV